MTTVKVAAFALLAGIASVSGGATNELNLSPAPGLLIRADWQEPAQLPPRFRNHCTFENFTGRPYCSDHCGIDYQFYYCSPASFGCCHLGHGYCDWGGLLRCHP
ncbi:MAG TPA: hypothetical protein VMR17_04655 [Xanthobacteraceae bacterium]|nr:hypothetical protein [Xanthobacteraceae bacterium]